MGLITVMVHWISDKFDTRNGHHPTETDTLNICKYWWPSAHKIIEKLPTHNLNNIF